ncbi:hypothetical protein A3L09_08150 [Thermococcus profundus]|uniref:Uncharacterized protein n=2 Tax=Thermococcus profundus TaxID=49899 RepID=A0A2Z2MBM5_THEPR|nr:hypothetical protein A3L09_08150 [Thermococcus profundus]
MYSRIKCGLLSACTSKLEALFKTAGVEFVRLLEPDPDVLASYVDGLYSRKSIEIVELTDETSRMFYLAFPQVFLKPEGELKPEFTLFFNVKSREGLEALLKVIVGKRIGGRRYRHRSGINFAVSFLGSFLLSVLVSSSNFWLQYILLIALTLLIYAVLDYPFSLLHLKGVEVLSNDPIGKETVKVVRMVRLGKKKEKAE